MCGIVGSFILDPNTLFTLTAEYIEKMRDVMTHRGPSGAGVWLAENASIGLGHRRLSIVDLSESAAQPMISADKNVVLTFNGEIYNHAEIKIELQRSHPELIWKTSHSDTEVLLNAYIAWGEECVHKFRGMFAFAIWDALKEELFLARDRMGIKPLYYSIHNGRFVFASEIKALLADPEQKRAVNEEAFFHYLSFLTTPSPMTLFEGISKLPNATWMKVKKNGAIETKIYWDALQNATDLSENNEEMAISCLREKLDESIALRKMADVPVGCFLSGGIDSSTITALFSKGEKENTVHTFTIGCRGAYKGYAHEMDYAEEMATFIKSNHHEHNLTQAEMLEFLPHLIRLQDEPIADPSCVPVYYLSKMARANGVIVVQGGEGADEIYMGYPGWKMAHKMEKISAIKGLKPFKWALLKAFELSGKAHHFRHEYVRRSVKGYPIFWGGAEAFGDYEKRKLLSPALRQKFKEFDSFSAIEPILNRFKNAPKHRQSNLNWMSYLDLNFRLPELLLMRIDKMTMACSLEARVPFLDHKFVETSMGIPENIRLGDGVTLKYILKKAVRGLISDTLIDRSKQGLQMPLNDWFFSEYGEKSKQDILEFAEKSGLMDVKATRHFLEQNRGPQAWYLLNVALWWKAYIEPHQNT